MRKTDRNAQLVRFYMAGNSLMKTGKRFGVSESRVWHILVAEGIKLRPPGATVYIADERILAGVRLVNAGQTFAASANSLGFSGETLRSRAAKMGLHVVVPDKSPKRLWTAAEHEFVAKHYKRDRSAQEIADALGRSRNEIIGHAYRTLIPGKTETLPASN